MIFLFSSSNFCYVVRRDKCLFENHLAYNTSKKYARPVIRARLNDENYFTLNFTRDKRLPSVTVRNERERERQCIPGTERVATLTLRLAIKREGGRT